MTKSIYIFFLFLLSITFINAQTAETEPNDFCTDSGVKTITANGTYTGTVDDFVFGQDRLDIWKINAGSSGSIIISMDYAHVLCNSESFDTSPCAGTDTRLGEITVPPGSTSVPFNLDPSRYYILQIAYVSGDASVGVPYSITVSGTAVLPVELTSFSAIQIENKIELSWQTATELTNYGFEVEKADVKNINLQEYEWVKIGFVEGHGNSNSPKNYTFTDNNFKVGTIKYRLKQIDTDGNFKYSNEVEVKIDIPSEYALKQNYPNPFNPSTTIRYQIPTSGIVSLKVYDVLSKEVANLVNEEKTAGRYEVKFDAADLPSGVYFYKIQAGNFIKTKKMILMK